MNEVGSPKWLAERAIKKGIKIIVGDVCPKGCHTNAIYYYERKETKGKNGCMYCAFIDKNRSDVDTNGVTWLDDNGVRVYEGLRRCKCKSKVKLAENAYGSNAGRCRDCAIEKQNEQQYGKAFRRMNTIVNSKAHKFMVNSIERSEAVEVAPRNLMEWLEVKDLVYKCEVMNQKERALDTGIRWEIGHKYPAAGVIDNPDVRGKSTIENLFLIMKEINRKAGDREPTFYETKQTINIKDCRTIQRSYEASKAWKDRKSEWTRGTIKGDAEWKAREIKEQEAHAERVKELTKGSREILEFFNVEQESFESLIDRYENQWNKFAVAMANKIDGYLKMGRKTPAIKARDERLTVEAFCGAGARSHAVLMTLRQIADAERIINAKPEENSLDEIAAVKRCAVLWANDVLSNRKVLVMGFTHKFIKDGLSWGTETGSNGEQWLCVWRQKNIDQYTDPLSGEINPDEVNPAITLRDISLPHTLDENTWLEVEKSWLYEESQKKAIREQAEERQRQREAAEKEQAAVKIEDARKSIDGKIKQIETQWYSKEGEYYDFANEKIPSWGQMEAYSAICRKREEMAEIIDQLIKMKESDPLQYEMWLPFNDYKVNRMFPEPVDLFHEAANPF